MAHPQIIIPGAENLDPRALVQAGLEDWIGQQECAMIPGGPDGGPGLLASWRPGHPQQRIGYYPDEQEWLPATCESGTKPAYWIGFWKDSPPTPEQLGKDTRQAGYLVELRDGNNWSVPAAHDLPRDVRFHAAGRITEVVKPEHAEFWEESQHWVQHFLLMDESVIAGYQIEPRMAMHVYRALRINYRVTPEVLNYLTLLDGPAVITCCRATIDGLLLDDVLREKKTETESVVTPAT